VSCLKWYSELNPPGAAAFRPIERTEGLHCQVRDRKHVETNGQSSMLLLASLALVGSAEASVFKKEGTPENSARRYSQASDQRWRSSTKRSPRPGPRFKMPLATPCSATSDEDTRGGGVAASRDRRRQQDEEGNLHEDGRGAGWPWLRHQEFPPRVGVRKEVDLDRFINSGWELGAQGTGLGESRRAGASAFQGAVSVTPVSGCISSPTTAWRWS